MTSKVATPRKRGRPAKAEATPVKAKSSADISPKAKENIVPQKEEVTMVSEELAPKVLESVDVKKRKSIAKATTKVKPTVTESDQSESVQSDTEQPSDDSQTDSEETIKAPTPKNPESKKLKTGKKEKALPSKEKKPAETESAKEAKSKPESGSHKNTLKSNSTPAFTLENDKALLKKGSIESELEPLPNVKEITKWASKYKEGLLIKEKNFILSQTSLSKKVQAALLKQGVSVSNKKCLESLDDFLFGNNRQVDFQNGFNVSILWLVTSWRYLRGTYKSSVLKLVNSNEDQKVQKATKDIFFSVKNALNSFQNAKKPDDVFCNKYKNEIGNWVASLSTISGVSAVTATAILGMLTDEIPYMSPEGLLASLGTTKGSHEEKTLIAYLEYVGSAVKEFGGKLKPKEIESGWYYNSFKL